MVSIKSDLDTISQTNATKSEAILKKLVQQKITTPMPLARNNTSLECEKAIVQPNQKPSLPKFRSLSVLPKSLN